jgi:hypothetical protein
MISPVISFWNTANSLSNCFATSAAYVQHTSAHVRAYRSSSGMC